MVCAVSDDLDSCAITVTVCSKTLIVKVLSPHRSCQWARIGTKSSHSLAARNKLSKFEHDSVQHIHLLPPCFFLSAAEIAERVHFLLVSFAVPSFYFAGLRICHCTQTEDV